MSTETLTSDEPRTTDNAPAGHHGPPDPRFSDAERPDGQNTADVADTAADTPTAVVESATAEPLKVEETRAAFEAWSRRRQDLEAKIAERKAQADALAGSIAALRRAAILGEAELGAASPLLAERATLQAEIAELGELLQIAQAEEGQAQAIYLRANLTAYIVRLHEQALALAERAKASDERIDAALAAFFETLDERWSLFGESQRLVKNADDADANSPDGVSQDTSTAVLRELQGLPLVWDRIEHANYSKHPRKSPYLVQL
ncbi:MAG: hypothetical protein ABSE58_06160 [Candidatus Limnocylindrales bacterium]|jgi:chromosome segregation ATPase